MCVATHILSNNGHVRCVCVSQVGRGRESVQISCMLDIIMIPSRHTMLTLCVTCMHAQGFLFIDQACQT